MSNDARLAFNQHSDLCDFPLLSLPPPLLSLPPLSPSRVSPELGGGGQPDSQERGGQDSRLVSES